MRVTRRVAILAAAALICVPAGRAEAETLPEVITVSDNHAVKRWDSAGRESGSVQVADGATILVVAFPGGREFATGSSSGLVAVYDVSSGRAQHKTNVPGGITAMDVNAEGAWIAAACADKNVRIVDVRSSRVIGEASANDSAIQGLLFGHDNALISGSSNGTIRYWNLRREGSEVQIRYHAQISAHDDAITALSLSPDGSLLASVSSDGYLKTWQSDGALGIRVRIAGRAVRCVAFSPDGRIIATGDDDGRVKVWNSDSGASLPFNGTHGRAVRAVAWASDGEVLVSAGEDGMIHYWNVKKNRSLGNANAGNAICSLAVLP